MFASLKRGIRAFNNYIQNIKLFTSRFPEKTICKICQQNWGFFLFLLQICEFYTYILFDCSDTIFSVNYNLLLRQ